MAAVMSAFGELVKDVRSLMALDWYQKGGVVEMSEEDWRDRFYDEHDEPELPEFYGCCGACYEFDRCDIPGHEDVGYCPAAGEFHLVTDPDECD